jgi:hypothetical protein
MKSILNKLFPKRYIWDKKDLEFKPFLYTINRFLIYLIVSIIIGISLHILIASHFTSSKEKVLKEENKNMYSNIYIMQSRLNDIMDILNTVQENDSIVYRTIFDTNPYYRNYDNKTIEKYDSLENLDPKYLVESTYKKILRVERCIADEYYDMEKIKKLAKTKRDFLESIPSIQPISNKNLKRTASGYGWRIDPLYHIRKFHFGLDFSSPIGTEVYSTGKGKVIYASASTGGYGNMIMIDHGYGYRTLFGHLSKILVKEGQLVSRGTTIGNVGSTGMSTGPHLHYEVIKNDKKINPINFFFNDLSIEDYDKILKLSSNMNKTFD